MTSGAVYATCPGSLLYVRVLYLYVGSGLLYVVGGGLLYVYLGSRVDGLKNPLVSFRNHVLTLIH